MIYNEIDPFACAWLRNLVNAEHIGDGRVETRSIRELRPRDVEGASQFHAFAGIGVWSYALRLAGWPDDVPVWTGSCPCQPFSQAGRRKGNDDERHLWPSWFSLIEECRPPIVFGEQVASPDGREWLDAVLADLENAGYETGSTNLCAAGVGAPHLRQRLYFVAITNGKRRERLGLQLRKRTARSTVSETRRRGASRELADGAEPRRSRRGTSEEDGRQASQPRRLRDARIVGDASGTRGRRDTRAVPRTQARSDQERIEARRFSDVAEFAGATRGAWDPCDWIPCNDPGGIRWRPVEPGTQPLAHGASARVGRLRCYGNAIVAPLAKVFIQSVMEYLDASII